MITAHINNNNSSHCLTDSSCLFIYKFFFFFSLWSSRNLGSTTFVSAISPVNVTKEDNIKRERKLEKLKMFFNKKQETEG